MKLTWFIHSVILASSALAQTGPPLPATLPQLASILPSLVHRKTFQPGPFSEAVTAALRKDPSSSIVAAAICAKNLEDPDPKVREWTLAVLYSIAITPEGPAALKPAHDQMTEILVHGDDASKRGVLVIAIDLGKDAPDSFISPLEQLLAARYAPESIRAGAAGALVSARPANPEIQQAVVDLINNANEAKSLRREMIHSCASPYVGPIINDNAVRIANTATDKDFRDAAIYAATQIGPAAVERIRNAIEAILKNPAESDSSRLTASAAFQMLR